MLSSIGKHGQAEEEAPGLPPGVTEPWQQAGPAPQFPKRVSAAPDPMLLLQRHTQQRKQVLASLAHVAPGTMAPEQYAMLFKQVHAHVQLLLQVNHPLCLW